MSREKELIRREFLSRKEMLVGTIIGAARADRFDGVAPGAGVMWVCDVEIGSNNPLFNVPIKGGSHLGRDFASLGQTVLLRRNLLGRYQVVGPGDRAAAPLNTIEYDLVTQDVAATTSRGFATVQDPFEFYQGPRAMKGNPSVTFASNPGDDTLARATGSFIADGFLSGDSVIITSPLNSQSITIALVAAGQLNFTGNPFVDEGPITSVTVGVAGTSRWNDGVTPWPSRRILDADGNTVSAS
jgi:hypothetical protein